MKSYLSLNKWRILSWLHARLVITVNLRRGNNHARKAYQDETSKLSLHVLKQILKKYFNIHVVGQSQQKIRRWS